MGGKEVEGNSKAGENRQSYGGDKGNVGEPIHVPIKASQSSAPIKLYRVADNEVVQKINNSSVGPGATERTSIVDERRQDATERTSIVDDRRQNEHQFTPTTETCFECSVVEADIRCKTCGQVYCELCSKSVHDSKMGRLHQLVDIVLTEATPASMAEICSVCDLPDAVLRCKTCEREYCRYCSSVEHGEYTRHEIVDIVPMKAEAKNQGGDPKQSAPTDGDKSGCGGVVMEKRLVDIAWRLVETSRANMSVTDARFFNGDGGSPPTTPRADKGLSAVDLRQADEGEGSGSPSAWSPSTPNKRQVEETTPTSPATKQAELHALDKMCLVMGKELTKSPPFPSRLACTRLGASKSIAAIDIALQNHSRATTSSIRTMHKRKYGNYAAGRDSRQTKAVATDAVSPPTTTPTPTHRSYPRVCRSHYCSLC